MTFYDGGSDKDAWYVGYVAEPGNYILSAGNQIFITFTTDGNAVGKGFTVKITFGKIFTTLFCNFFIFEIG